MNVWMPAKIPSSYAEFSISAMWILIPHSWSFRTDGFAIDAGGMRASTSWKDGVNIFYIHAKVGKGDLFCQAGVEEGLDDGGSSASCCAHDQDSSLGHLSRTCSEC